MTDQKVTWTFFDVWNTSIEEGRPERINNPRDYIYASELGQSYIDRYLKMTGVSYTNPPNARSKRKFEAGNIWEWIVQIILIRAGILLETQKEANHTISHLEFQEPFLSVHGRVDFIAGGKPDWEKAEKEIKSLYLPETTMKGALAIIEKLKQLGELKPIILEIKSKGSLTFDTIERTKKPDPHHTLQLFHYLKALGMDEGHLVYICRDDCRMIEFGVFNKNVNPYYSLYHEDIKTMTSYIRKGKMPAPEPLMIFDTDTFKFRKNWKVEYSPYLTHIYGYKDPMEYYEKWSRKASQWNRVFKRCVDRDKMTDLNKEVIKDIEKFFPHLEDLVVEAREKGVVLNDTEMGQSGTE